VEFAVDLQPAHVRFGVGARELLAEECDRLGVGRVLLVCTPSGAARYRTVADALGSRLVATFAEAEPHCPEPVVERCRALWRSAGADGVVTVGGGSTIGLGKILTAEERAKFVCIPTTYSGSEMTDIFGRKIGREKRTARNPACRAHTVLYDPELTLGLPRHETVTTGMNSLAHAVEALYPPLPNPVAFVIAREALRAHRDGLPGAAANPTDIDARSQALYGGFLGGLLVGMTGIALHHRLCHVLGGLFDLPHGETNSVVLAHVVAYNAAAAPEAARAISDVFGDVEPARAIDAFARRIGAPTSLREIGMPEDGVDAVVKETLARGGWNPRAPDEASLRELVRAAWDGQRPQIHATSEANRIT
jgi:alcohol dehydrogenase class IV